MIFFFFLNKIEHLVTSLSHNLLVEGLIAAIKFPITSEPIYLAILRDRGSACAPSTSSPLRPSSLSPERERERRFIVSNYLLVDRDKRVTRMYASGFHEKSRVTRGVPRPRKGKTAWVCAEETDVVTVYVLSRILRACGSCSCDTPDRYMYYKYARVPMNGPRVEVVTCEASTSTSRFYSSINDSMLDFNTVSSCFDIFERCKTTQRFLKFSFSFFFSFLVLKLIGVLSGSLELFFS